jgi:hypothetical protein
LNREKINIIESPCLFLWKAKLSYAKLDTTGPFYSLPESYCDEKLSCENFSSKKIQRRIALLLGSQLLVSNVRLVRRVQTVDATHALNLSAGVPYPGVFLGRSFNCRAIAFSFA